MDMTQIGAGFQNFGAMTVIALMVFKSPAILEQLSNLIQRIIGNVRETQTEALNVFRAENDKIITLIGTQFTTVQNTLADSLNELKEMAGELKHISQRVEHLERDKPG